MDNQDPNQELQSSVEIEVQEHEDLGGADPDQHQGSESATDSEPEHEENAEGATNEQQFNQEAINAAIDRQHAKYREEQRRRLAAEQELERLRGGQAASDPEPQIHEVNEHAEDLQEEIKLRDESIRAHIAWSERQKKREQQAHTYQQQTATEQEQQAAQQVDTFFKRAAEAKVDQNELSKSIQTIGQYQLGQEVASYLLSDDKGVHMTQALAKNPVLLAELSFMQPHERILHIERNVRARLNVKPRASQGKPPPTRVKGKAAETSDQYPLTGGKVTVE